MHIIIATKYLENKTLWKGDWSDDIKKLQCLELAASLCYRSGQAFRVHFWNRPYIVVEYLGEYSNEYVLKVLERVFTDLSNEQALA